MRDIVQTVTKSIVEIATAKSSGVADFFATLKAVSVVGMHFIFLKKGAFGNCIDCTAS